MLRNSKIIVFVLLIVFLNLNLVHSRELVETSDLSSFSIEELMNIKVITASRYEQNLSEAPATIYVITEDQIRNRGYFNLMELLEDIPGVEIQKNSSSEFNMIYSMRGIYGNEKFIILMDGFQVNSPTGTPHAVGANYPLDNVKRVEVVLGPASALYGVDAFSGIINIITKSGSAWNGGQISSGFASFGTSSNSFTYGQKFDNGNGSIVVTGNYYYTDNPFWPDYFPDEYRYYTDVYSQTGEMDLYGNPVYLDIYPLEMPESANSFQLRAVFKNFEFGYNRNYESHNTGTGCGPEFSIIKEDVIHAMSVENYYAKHNYKSGNEKWKFQTSINKSTFMLDPDTKWFNLYTNFQNGWEYGKTNSYKFDEQVDYCFTDNLAVIGGFSVEEISALPKTNDLPYKFDVNKPAAEQNIPYLGTENLVDENGNSLEVMQYFYWLDYQNYGAYLQFHYKPWQIVQLTLGTRYDYNTQYSSSFNPRIGLVLTPGKKLKLKMMYGEAFLEPSPYKSYYHYGTFFPIEDPNTGEVDVKSAFMHLPNPDLKPEDLSTFETSIFYTLADNVVVSFNSYYTEIDNLIVRGGSYEFGSYFKRKLIDVIERPGNIGSMTIYGFTPSIDALCKLKEIKLNCRLSYNYIDGEVDDGLTTRERIPFAAKHTYKGGIDLIYKNIAFSPDFIWRGKSEYTEPGFESDGYFVVDIFARHSNTLKTRFVNASTFVKINNLFDVKYYNVLESAGSIEAMNGAPQKPFTIMGGFILNF